MDPETRIVTLEAELQQVRTELAAERARANQCWKLATECHSNVPDSFAGKWELTRDLNWLCRA